MRFFCAFFIHFVWLHNFSPSYFHFITKTIHHFNENHPLILVTYFYSNQLIFSFSSAILGTNSSNRHDDRLF